MRCGILTFHYSDNYGALLQAYALSTFLKRLGHDPVIINRSPKIESANRNIIRVKIHQYIRGYFLQSFNCFRNNYLNISKPIFSFHEMAEFASKLDAVIVGSDQVWRLDYTKGLGLNNFLDFVPQGVKKIAYAASFGKESLGVNKKTTNEIAILLRMFDGISVRESSGIEICANTFGVSAEHLLDPTLLLDSSDYDRIIRSKKRSHSKFITQYFLDSTTPKRAITKHFSDKLGLSVKNIYRESKHDFSLKNIGFTINKYKYPSFSNWLSGIKDSEFVITDSFHGLVFSILYNKQFVCIGNEKRGLTRMLSLLEKFGLKDRLILEDNFIDKIAPDTIDYKKVNRIRKQEINKSRIFLEKILSEKRN